MYHKLEEGVTQCRSKATRTYDSWGVVARTSEGEIVAARAGCSDAVHDAFTAELRAMEEAFNLAAEVGVIRAVFETDAQLLAMALNSTKADFSSEAAIIEDLKIQSRTWFSSCSIRFSRRSSNNVAHALAQAGIIMTVNSCKCWDYEVPRAPVWL